MQGRKLYAYSRSLPFRLSCTPPEIAHFLNRLVTNHRCHVATLVFLQPGYNALSNLSRNRWLSKLWPGCARLHINITRRTKNWTPEPNKSRQPKSAPTLPNTVETWTTWPLQIKQKWWNVVRFHTLCYFPISHEHDQHIPQNCSEITQKTWNKNQDIHLDSILAIRRSCNLTLPYLTLPYVIEVRSIIASAYHQDLSRPRNSCDRL